MQTGNKDAALHLEVFVPPAGNWSLAPLDIGVDQTSFSNQWRQGFLHVAWPALPNHTNSALNITLTMVDSGDGGATYQQGSTFTNGVSWALPEIVLAIPGVAINGAPAGACNFPFPPDLRGPVGLLVSPAAGIGDCSACLITADYIAG